ncbi:acetyl-CoA carboxylase biotin carboxylase subunit [sediment metagenome]|uniref:Acetyl-CoA carboxylase biotin carboxylase subunit n=1 Tax=sediment metagenome TaxID=749907 RepID=D9PKA6_9ZZZZ
MEESPSPVLDKNTRRSVCEAAVALCKAANYTNAGTIEFLYQGGKFYFMEMNTRIQVEHPVTEMVVRIGRDGQLDLIEEQIRVAAGEKLRWRQKDIVHVGHAIECRINAEDPDMNFAPFPGTVRLYIPPSHPNVRIDSFIYSGYRIPPTYDSMIGKLIAYGADRAEAMDRAKRALAEMIIDGIKTTIPFHRKLFEDHRFVQSEYDINFVDQHFR